MSESTQTNQTNIVKAAAISVAIAFLYATVLTKLGRDWWSDENYSHGLLVPFVIGMIVWKEWDGFKSISKKPALLLGGLAIAFSLFLLFAGTLGAELFTTRISFVVMLVGIVLYLFGTRVLNLLLVPVALFLLAIPIPQIIFNRIAFPLQIWASQMAVRGIRLFDVPTLRKGNVIDILPQGSTQTISLEVVEACSGIRSLMTLVTLALILGYFTRRYERGGFANLAAPDLLRVVALMILAVPIAVLTNAARVTVTGILTYHWGKQATDGSWHDASGWMVYVVALVLLIGANLLLKKIFRGREINDAVETSAMFSGRSAPVLPLVVAIVVGGIAVNWFVNRGETSIERKPLTELSQTLGDWRQRGSEIKFSEQTESVLKTSDYTMREYTFADGRIANIYVGYYSSQRSGATYHSPQNCLPGAGWVMKDPQIIDIPTADGKTFKANRYIVENGIYNEVMIYWYQGRGRVEASEYTDKINTIWDSVTRSRSDGAIVRVMTSVGADEAAGLKAASDLSARLAEALPPYVPE
ncbi:MAG TPA: EpsI family protein [Pyrinomonadaceae bacterium]|nr:EpsI family protein [Acidobacteriota bacterium]HQZ96589.1 EpsI family protein [Pyrinomonadaceae bacterium]